MFSHWPELILVNEIHKELTELDTQEMLPLYIDLSLCEAASNNRAHLSYLLISNPNFVMFFPFYILQFCWVEENNNMIFKGIVWLSIYIYTYIYTCIYVLVHQPHWLIYTEIDFEVYIIFRWISDSADEASSTSETPDYFL